MSITRPLTSVEERAVVSFLHMERNKEVADVIDPAGELYWEHMAVGYFLGLGFNPADAVMLVEAYCDEYNDHRCEKCP